jgi:hypothetical protein
MYGFFQKKPKNRQKKIVLEISTYIVIYGKIAEDVFT